MVKYFKKYNTKVPSWQDILNNLDWSVHNGDKVKQNDFGFFVTHRADLIKESQPIFKEFEAVEAHLYLNIFTKAPTYAPHKDDVEVIFWQCQGTTKWLIENKDEYILKPGDLIIVPKGVLHKVYALTPRAGISFSK